MGLNMQSMQTKGENIYSVKNQGKADFGLGQCLVFLMKTEV